MLQWLKVLGVAALLAAAGSAGMAQTKPERPVGCAKYADGPKKDACLKREAELKAARQAKRQAAAAKAKEERVQLNATCADAPDRAGCVREERAKLKGGRAKAKDRTKKGG